VALALVMTWPGIGIKRLAPGAPIAGAEALPPPPKIEDIPDGPLPLEADDETRRKVMRATAYLKVTRIGNLEQEGSGFFGAEPGLVITNAHVVGMGSAGCAAPANVEVVVHSGEADEHTLTGEVLGADWVNDLAVLRVSGDKARWPA